MNISLRGFKSYFWKLFNAVDGRLKFPELKTGETGIQCGFDMSAPVTSDLFLMCNRVKNTGNVIGIDADPLNHRIAISIIEKNKLNVVLVEKALFSEPGSSELVLGDKISWNQLKKIPVDREVIKNAEKTIVVQQSTLDLIVGELKTDIQKIGHINITLNGSEYYALLGMKKILTESTDLAITVIAGRNDPTGTIDGKPDHEIIIEFLHQYNFRTKFRRINQLFWWGFIVNLLIKRKWIYNKKNYGVIMAAKGNKRIPWFQSFS